MNSGHRTVTESKRRDPSIRTKERTEPAVKSDPFMQRLPGLHEGRCAHRACACRSGICCSRASSQSGFGFGTISLRITQDYGARRRLRDVVCKLLIKWWSGGGSNPGPSHCERDALPAELPPRAQKLLESVRWMRRAQATDCTCFGRSEEASAPVPMSAAGSSGDAAACRWPTMEVRRQSRWHRINCRL